MYSLTLQTCGREQHLYHILLCASGPSNGRQKAVVDAFVHAWTAYKTYAWGHDELKPLSRGWQEWMGVALTMVDSLDTMYMMGLKQGTHRLSSCSIVVAHWTAGQQAK